MGTAPSICLRGRGRSDGRFAVGTFTSRPGRQVLPLAAPLSACDEPNAGIVV